MLLKTKNKTKCNLACYPNILESGRGTHYKHIVDISFCWIRNLYIRTTTFFILLLAFIGGACKKLVQIADPVNSVTTTEVFSTDAQANSAMAGIYTSMIGNNGDLVFSNGATSVFTGMSSDELIFYFGSGYPQWLFNINDLKANSGNILTSFWTPAYSNIYKANAAISGLAASNSGALHDSVRNALTGEAKFIRAFCYFYLINLFGDVPLVLTVDFNRTDLMKRTSKEQVYLQIIRDLKDAKNLLPSDYSISAGERIRPNKWAATALLARAYLFTEDWSNAEAQATAVINNNLLYSLVDSLSNVFDKNSREAIWQLQQNSAGSFKNGTYEGGQFIPAYFYSSPRFFITNQLWASFEGKDKRKQHWINSIEYAGSTYYFPYKYVLSNAQTVIRGSIPQYYMVLRLAEQYLIRSEARTQLGEDNAVDDLNIIRNRAGLDSYAGATDKASLLAIIYHERQTELFAEWGHRWLDLKRTGLAHSILSAISYKKPWNDSKLLYPIPYSEVIANPNLTQNPGY